MRLMPDDWGALFRVDTPLLEIFVRGTVMYFAIFVLLRLFWRATGGLGISDLIVIVVIADAAQNAMAGDYKSITDGVLLVSVIVLWNYVLDWLAFHIPALRTLASPDPQILVRDGRIVEANLRKSLISKDELEAALREQGVDDVGNIKAAHLEGSGQISVVQQGDGTHAHGGGNNTHRGAK